VTEDEILAGPGEDRPFKFRSGSILRLILFLPESRGKASTHPPEALREG
jgi:hypothetical protein